MRRQWTEEEVAYLEKYYERRGVDYIARRLKRSIDSIKRKAQNLGYNAYVCEDLYVRTVAKCFDCDSRVINRWINDFELPYRIVQRGQSTCKLISAKTFWKWAKEHQNLIPWNKYERFSILPEPEWVPIAIKEYNVKNNRKKITEFEKQRIINLRKKEKCMEKFIKM